MNSGLLASNSAFIFSIELIVFACFTVYILPIIVSYIFGKFIAKVTNNIYVISFNQVIKIIGMILFVALYVPVLSVVPWLYITIVISIIVGIIGYFNNKNVKTINSDNINFSAKSSSKDLEKNKNNNNDNKKYEILDKYKISYKQNKKYKY